MAAMTAFARKEQAAIKEKNVRKRLNAGMFSHDEDRDEFIYLDYTPAINRASARRRRRCCAPRGAAAYSVTPRATETCV